MEWVNNDGLVIIFDTIPKPHIRFATPYDTEKEKKDIIEFPFINCREFKVTIKYENKIYEFSVPKEYKWDGATVPKFFWRIVGSSTQPEFLIASCIHDILCENHNYIDNNRNLSSKIFKELLLVAGVSKIKAQIMYLAVDNFQRFCGWKK